MSPEWRYMSQRRGYVGTAILSLTTDQPNFNKIDNTHLLYPALWHRAENVHFHQILDGEKEQN